MNTRHEGRSEQVRRLGSVPVAGVEPQAILTRVPPRRLQVKAGSEEAADDAVFPPSPVLRVKWGRVAAWSVSVLLAGVTVARFVNEHRELAFWTLAFGAVYVVHVAVERVRA